MIDSLRSLRSLRALPSGLLLRAEVGKFVRCSGRGCGCGFSGFRCRWCVSLRSNAPPNTSSPAAPYTPAHALLRTCPPLPCALSCVGSLGARWVLVGSLGCSLALLGARWFSGCSLALWVLVGSLGCSLGARWLSCLLLRAEMGKFVRCSGRGCGCGFSGFRCRWCVSLRSNAPPNTSSPAAPYTPAHALLRTCPPLPCALSCVGSLGARWVLVGSVGCSLALLGARWLWRSLRSRVLVG